MRIAVLPVEIWAFIISKLDFDGLRSASLVCRSWEKFSSTHKVPRLLKHVHDTIYHHHFMSNPPDLITHHDAMDRVRFSRSLINHVAFVTFPNTSTSTTTPSAAKVYFPLYERALEWPLPAQLSSIYSSRGVICGLITPSTSGGGFRFIVSSDPITRSCDWSWIHLPPSESVRFDGTRCDRLPHVKFVAEGIGSKKEHFYVILVGDRDATEIEVYSSRTGSWRRHLRPENSSYRRETSEGDIAITVLGDAKAWNENDLLAVSFDPESETWGCRVPFGGFPPLACSARPYTYMYAGVGEHMVVAGQSMSSALYHEWHILSEKRGESNDRASQQACISYPDMKFNFSSSGNTMCFQRIVIQKPVLSRCYVDKFDILNFWNLVSFATTDDAFLITCCE